MDYRSASGGGSRGGKAAEGRRFIAGLQRAARLRGKDTFTSSELFSLANEINLQVLLRDSIACRT